MRYVYLRYAKLNLLLEKGGFGALSFKVLQINNERNNLSAIPFYELNSRLELETPSVRVKCSTTELIQPVGLMCNPFVGANIVIIL